MRTATFSMRIVRCTISLIFPGALALVLAPSLAAGPLSVGSEPEGVAISPDGSFAYVCDENASAVTRIRTSDNAVTATIFVGRNPVGVAISPDGSFAYVANSEDNSVTRIRTSDDAVIATIGVGALPYNVAISPDNTFAYVTNAGGNSVTRIQSSDNTVTYTITVGTFPYDVAISPDGTFAYVTNLGEDSNVSRIQTSDNAVTATIPVAGGPSGVAISPDGSFAYVTKREIGTVSRIRTSDNAVTATVPVGSTPENVAISSDGSFAYVTNDGSNTVTRIQTSDNTATATMSVGTYPVGVAISPDDTFVFVTNLGDNTVARIETLATPFPPAPAIATQPQSQSVAAGSSVTFTVAASGSTPLSYQWYFGGSPISGATSPAYTIGSAQSPNAGIYTCTVTNAVGAVTSNIATLAVGAGPIVFIQQPSSQTIASGSTVVFSVSAAGVPATYQWSLNGAPLADGASGSATISGSAGPALVISGATLANAGTYTCAATNSTGTVTSNPAQLTVSSTTDVGRLINISWRGEVGTGANILIAGFVAGGAGTTGSESLLIRVSGPALIPLGVTGTLPDPQLQLFQSNSNGTSTLIGSNAGWAGNAVISSTAAAVGAFTWTNASSHDSALLVSPDGPYTAQISGQGGDNGVALAELYDATPAGTYTPTTPRLINVSARNQVGTGANILIGGFVIGGTTSETVLIRASGPALVALGGTGTLPDPELQLYSGSTLLESNTGWGGNAQIASVVASLGAFSWGSSATPDSALLVTLPPGAYTAQVSGASGDTGVALLEVYEVRLFR
jgi:YVTN family beta-propeller protein